MHINRSNQQLNELFSTLFINKLDRHKMTMQRFLKRHFSQSQKVNDFHGIVDNSVANCLPQCKDMLKSSGIITNGQAVGKRIVKTTEDGTGINNFRSERAAEKNII